MRLRQDIDVDFMEQLLRDQGWRRKHTPAHQGNHKLVMEKPEPTPSVPTMLTWNSNALEGTQAERVNIHYIFTTSGNYVYEISLATSGSRLLQNDQGVFAAMMGWNDRSYFKLRDLNINNLL